MKAIPVFGERLPSNSLTACMPPAEAPTATIGKFFLFGFFFTSAEIVSVMVQFKN
jgi:hypothetical protein